MRIIKYISMFVVLAIASAYILYRYENTIVYKKEIDQIKFDFTILKAIDQNMSQKITSLLAGDIQRALIAFEKDKRYIDKSVCELLGDDNINLLQRYDSNVSITTLKQLAIFCNKK